jgi:hypothetical protein
MATSKYKLVIISDLSESLKRFSEETEKALMRILHCSLQMRSSHFNILSEFKPPKN